MAKYRGDSNWTFRIGIKPAPSTIAKLFGEAAREFNDFKPAFLRLAPKIKAGIDRIIGSRGAAIGKPWPGLKDKYYLARKARMGWNTAELFATGLLAGSIKAFSVTKRALKVGTDVPYSKAAQWKGWQKGNNRIFVALDPQAIKDASDELSAESNSILARLASKLGSAA